MSLHRPFPLSEWEMDVFRTVVERFMRSMIQVRRNLSHGSTIRPQLIRDDPLGNKIKTLYQAAQQPFCGPFVPFRLEYLVQHDAMLIDPAPKPIFATRDFHNNFIEMPDITWTVLT